MKVWINGYLGLEAVYACRPNVEIEAEQLTLRELLRLLEPEAGDSLATPGPGRRLLVLLNGRHASHLPDGLDTWVRDGDHVAIFPPAAGG